MHFFPTYPSQPFSSKWSTYRHSVTILRIQLSHRTCSQEVKYPGGFSRMHFHQPCMFVGELCHENRPSTYVSQPTEMYHSCKARLKQRYCRRLNFITQLMQITETTCLQYCYKVISILDKTFHKIFIIRSPKSSAARLDVYVFEDSFLCFIPS